MFDWSESTIEVVINGSAVVEVDGWCRGKYGVIALPGRGEDLVYYLVDRQSRRALSPFLSLSLACIAAEIAEETIAQLEPSQNPGVATHHAWRDAGFHHTDGRTRFGDPIWGWSEFTH
ncbi:hypothetical protein [Hyphomicrobium sp.]|uniref:hypothetical protein n=1 Tax=Hyphomicrobium sp. TaxID=82 RepID=UPI002FE237AD